MLPYCNIFTCLESNPVLQYIDSLSTDWANSCNCHSLTHTHTHTYIYLYKGVGFGSVTQLFNTSNMVLQFTVALSPIRTLQFTVRRISSAPFGCRSSAQPPGFRGRCTKSQLQLTSLPTVTSAASPVTNCIGVSGTLESLLLCLEPMILSFLSISSLSLSL
jgi:hypothetical protein